MGRFDGKLLVSDMDATLLNDNHEVTAENFDAINYFISEGGLFTVASGRMIDAVRVYLDRIPVNAPAITYNGAKIYSFRDECTIYEKTIEEKRKAAYRKVFETTDFGLEVYSKEHIYVLRECFETERLKSTCYSVTYSMPDEIWDEAWTKALIIGDDKELDSFEPVYKSQYDTGYSVRSGKYYLDIVANGVSKGAGVKYLANQFGILEKDIYTVGDNMNDYEMVTLTPNGFAVSNAVDKLKKAAKDIVPSNNESAIAYIIENKIMQTKQ